MIDRIAVWVLTLKYRLAEERGQDLLEYAMLGGLIVLAILAVVGLMTGAIENMINGIGKCIDFDSNSVCSKPF